MDARTQETLLHADLQPTMSGINPYTGLQDTVSTITDIYLLNNGKQDIDFVDDSGATVTIVSNPLSSARSPSSLPLPPLSPSQLPQTGLPETGPPATFP
jgi:hypothetical protein